MKRDSFNNNSNLLKIRNKLQNGTLKEDQAIQILISNIQNKKKNELRINSLNFLEELKPKSKVIYSILENLAISDSNKIIRQISFRIIRKNYLKNSLNLYEWTLKYEKDTKCLIEIIKGLTQINSQNSRKILLKYLKRITIPDDFNSRTNEKYKKVIKTFFTSNKIHFLSTEEIASIVLNYIIITNLIEKFYYVHYKLNEEICLSYELDLSDIVF
jgi:hypothetical protein